MEIHPIITNNSVQNIFYIVEYGDRKAFVIDPADSELTNNFLEDRSLTLEHVFITHEHGDHYSGVKGLECESIYASEIAAENIPIKVSDIIREGESFFEHDDMKLKSVFVPGHTPGHMMFELYLEDNTYALFVGDTLFPGGAGNVYDGDTEMLYESVKKFEKYNDDVTIYSGHDYMENNFNFIKRYFPDKARACNNILKRREGGVYFTKIGDERKVNPFLSCTRDEFIRLRELRNNW